MFAVFKTHLTSCLKCVWLYRAIGDVVGDAEVRVEFSFNARGVSVFHLQCDRVRHNQTT